MPEQAKSPGRNGGQSASARAWAGTRRVGVASLVSILAQGALGTPRQGLPAPHCHDAAHAGAQTAVGARALLL